MLYLQGLKYAMVLMRGMLVLLLATVIIKIGILHPLGACGTTEKMLVTCHANSEQVPPRPKANYSRTHGHNTAI